MLRFIMTMIRLTCRGKVRYAFIAIAAACALLLLYHSLNVKVSSNRSGLPISNIDGVVENVPREMDVPSTDGKSTNPVSGLSVLSSWLWKSKPDEKFVCPKGLGRVNGKLNVDIDTEDQYSKLTFKTQYPYFWNVTFEERYLKTRENWKKLPLKVIVLPHSHNDPGWLKTFDSYYYSSTSFILNNMADRLSKYPNMTFVWSEISFFAKWWESLKTTPHVRDTVKVLLKQKQLEILTGGWVMTDEASPTFYAMLDQLIEGHQWLKTHLGVVPTNGWSIDPFGHSNTVPYLLRASGIENMVIQRTHYAWKERLASDMQLDFVWKQLFDSDATRALDVEPPLGRVAPDILCHMAPFDLYSIKHTCGPDQATCLQFDFRHIAGEYSDSTAVQITDENVDMKANLLLKQYGRVGSLFPHNVALVFLGDDFRYNHEVEWDQQYKNYQRLFDHINGQEDLHAQVGFGSLDDYFKLVRSRTALIKPEEGKALFPTLAGDFMPYGDRYVNIDASYWTGYFTTRPFLKHLTRELEYWLRHAEILYTFSRTLTRQRGNIRLQGRLNQDYRYLTTARESLGLFQHHDAITGTAKPNVMQDYGQRLYRGIRDAMGVISHSTQYVMLKDPIQSAFPATSYLFPDVIRSAYDILPQKVPYSLPKLSGRKVVVFNSQIHRRKEVLRVLIKSNPTEPFGSIKVIDDETKEELRSQLNPSWSGALHILEDVFELVFVVDLPPLTLKTLTLFGVPKMQVENRGHPRDPRPTVSIFLNDAFAMKKPSLSIFSFRNPMDEDIVLESPELSAIFSAQTGLLKEIKLIGSGAQDTKSDVSVNFQAYKSEDYRSGAYLFKPNRQEPIVNVTGRYPIIRVIRGPLVSEVTTTYPETISITSRVYHLEGPMGSGLELTTLFDIKTFPDSSLELFMRLETDVRSQDVFYTDANGFQMMRRTRVKSLPVEANYYPISTAAYIEDDAKRISLLVSHGHGATSQHQGHLEVMLDRRIRFDDNRGLGEGVVDNKLTSAQFWILLEGMKAPSVAEEFSSTIPALSLLGHQLSETLNYPAALLMSGVDGSETEQEMATRLSFSKGSLSCDYQLINFRSLPSDGDFDLPSNSSLLIVHRKGVSCRVAQLSSTKMNCGDSSTILSNKVGKENSWKFQNVRLDRITRTSLTASYEYENLGEDEEFKIEPMNLQAYHVRFAN